MKFEICHNGKAKPSGGINYLSFAFTSILISLIVPIIIARELNSLYYSGLARTQKIHRIVLQ